ncbi:MAG: DUF3857 domain-containing protein [Deltaproteobacteria bacterium]|nr:DUF3857 domain-containing protein [Deltaproteobacteria bacterium]
MSALTQRQIAQAAEGVNPYDARLQTAVEKLRKAGASATAVGPVFELAELNERVPDRDWSQPLADVVEGKGDPLVQAWAAFHLARLRDDQGRADEAAALRKRLGLIESFWVMGPFDAQSRAALEAPWAAELTPLQPHGATTFEGKEQTVTWRRAEDVARMGVTLLDAALAPQQEAGALLFVYVHSDREQPAALRLGSSGPVKAWVNGAPVFSSEVQRIARLDQDAALLALKKGENTLVIKTLSLEGAWRIVVRLTKLDGRALQGVHSSLQGQGAAVLGQARRLVAGPAPRHLGRQLEIGWQSALKSKRTAEARVWAEALARLWAYANPFDKDEKPVERVLNTTLAAGEDFTLRRLLGETAVQDNDRRTALQAALPLTTNLSERCLLLCDLVELAQTARRPVQAVALRNQALGLPADVACWPAVLSVAEDQRVASLPALARDALDVLPPPIRALPLVRKRQARALHSLGLIKEARAELQAVAAERPSDPDVLDALMSDARATAQTPALLQLTEAMAKRRPDLSFLVVDLAKVQEGAGQTQAALNTLDAALARVPGAAELHEAKGRLLARLLRPAEAAAALEHALALRPQNPTLRKYMEALARQASGGNADEAAADLARRYATDVWETAKRALQAGVPAQPADAAHVLLDRKVVHVHENGLSEMFAQRLVHVLTEPGARANDSFFIRYTPGSQEVEVRQARVFRKNASGVVETSSATGRDDRDLSEPWYALYYDNRAEVVTFEGLRPGDVVEIQYTVADVSARNELAGYFGDFQFVAETIPTDVWQYTLVGPKNKKFYFHEPSLTGFSRKQASRGADTEYQFEARDVPKMRPEPSMPGWAEVAPYFHVSTYETWDQVGRWYWNLVADQLVPDAEVKRRAIDAVKGLTSLQDKVQAIHKLVIQGTRYVALEFGIHGYKPYRVSQVLSRRFGDCKDKASLMVAMLKSVGVDAQIVLLRTRRGGQLDPSPASLAVFDHAIAYVPALNMYLDGTAEFSGMNELPHQDQATIALRVWPGGSQLVTTPVLPSQTNRALRTWDADVSADGTATINEVVRIVGQAAPEWRQHYQTEGERLEKYGKVWNARYPGATVQDLKFTGVGDPNEPVQVTAKINVPALAEPQGEQYLLPLSSRPPEYLRAYARLSERRTDLLLAYPWQHEETLSYRLPEGFVAVQVPNPVSLKAPFGQFEFAVKPSSDGRVVTVFSRLDMQEQRFTPADYPAFRTFLGTLEAALRGRVVIGKVNTP